jgi:hypothetical protein
MDGNQRHLCHVRRRGDAHAAQDLDSFGDRIDKVILFVVVLVEQQMQLIEGLAGQLPVVPR